MEGKTLKQHIYEILNNFPETRDNDNLLYIKVWESERLQNEYIAVEYGLFLNKFSKPSTIVASRRKIQKKCPLLRGKEYEIRQIKGGQKKKNKISNIDQLEFPVLKALKL